jgi:hypothetical protein
MQNAKDGGAVTRAMPVPSGFFAFCILNFELQ